MSQRDYPNIKLGFSNLTIASDGCTITAIARILGTTPDVVNERMKSVNGFSDGKTLGKGALVVWDKIKEAFPGTQVHRVWTYNNDDALRNVPNVIVEVDGAPIGGARHWLQYLGNQKAYDPWDGKIKSTASYQSPISYCIIKPPSTTPKTEDPMVCDPKSVRDMLVDKATKFDSFIAAGYETVQKVTDIIEGHRSRTTTVERERDEEKTQAAVEKQKAKNAEDRLAIERYDRQRQEESYLSTIKELKETNPDTQAIVTSCESQLKVERESKETAQNKLDKANIELAKVKALHPKSLIEKILFVLGI